MEYRVIINPSKEQEFLQLLKAWQSLEVVLDFELLEENANPSTLVQNQRKITAGFGRGISGFGRLVLALFSDCRT